MIGRKTEMRRLAIEINENERERNRVKEIITKKKGR